MTRFVVLFAAVASAVGCASEAPEPGETTDTQPAEEKSNDTPGGVNYSISEWRYTNAIRPGGELELYLQCYNKSDEPVDGPAVFGDSALSLILPGGSTVEPEVNPLGLWDGPANIVPGSSHGVLINITDLFDFGELGDYVVRWDVAGGTVELELYLQCYNKSDEPVDGPAVFGDSA
ncbi:MAG: hypothetical protein JSW52_03440, partial [Candidatus Coatesbacteria bacterium]